MYILYLLNKNKNIILKIIFIYIFCKVEKSASGISIKAPRYRLRASDVQRLRVIKAFGCHPP